MQELTSSHQMKRLRVQWLDDDMIQDCPWSASNSPIRRDGLDTLNDKEFVSDEVVAFGCRWCVSPDICLILASIISILDSHSYDCCPLNIQ